MAQRTGWQTRWKILLIEVLHRFIHRQQVHYRDTRLNIMAWIENKTSTRTEDPHPLPNLGADIFRVDGIPPENFVTMIEAVHKYGRYNSLGK